MAGEANGSSPYSRARAAAGLLLVSLVCVLAIIDAVSTDYSFELGPMGLMLGTGTVLLGVEGIRKAAERIVGGGQ